VDQAAAAPEVQRTAVDPSQVLQQQPTLDLAAEAADIATNQTHPRRVVLVVRALLSCATSCPLFPLPILMSDQTLVRHRPMTSPETKLSRLRATHL
jgi:hypothetical protein